MITCKNKIKVVVFQQKLRSDGDNSYSELMQLHFSIYWTQFYVILSQYLKKMLIVSLYFPTITPIDHPFRWISIRTKWNKRTGLIIYPFNKSTIGTHISTFTNDFWGLPYLIFCYNISITNKCLELIIRIWIYFEHLFSNNVH